ncbi:LPS export ABC transporter permease LptF [Ferrimonas marina]|uniref:Lipopolysaccharide export system permease protein LptF n=1 Tax=Ferrimonas marina TaxID=299255 RepID=A0A1M5X9C4_9GAMM|nr:LPS export ABC transporter permease LptF [Ferrimonas marina]SHH96158.1 lipopolysaccharide export system permease protein [Ferrimonas marina]
MIVLRYLLREAFRAQIAVLAVLVTIFISQQFVRILADAAEGQFPGKLVVTLLALNLPELLSLILPLSLFLGVMMAHGRMYAESEMTVLHAVGISEWYVTRVTLVLGFIMAAIAGVTAIYVAPWAQEKEYQVLEKAESEAGLAALVQGRFQRAANGKGVIYVEGLSKGNLEKVFVAQLPREDSDPQTALVLADGGRIVEAADGSQRLQLTDGTRVAGVINSKEFNQLEFGAYEMEIKSQEASYKRRKMSAYSMTQLMEEGSPDAWAEIHWRLAVPIALPLLILIAVPMSRVNVRQGKFAKLMPAILIYLGYFGLLMAGRKAIENEALPPQLGLWWIHIMALIIGLLLIGRSRPSGLKVIAYLRSLLPRRRAK